MQLQITGLSKRYAGGVQALDDVSLTIPRGMYGLLGPNGAGKSTLMRIIATLQEPDEGRVRLGELDVLRQKDAVRRILGYLPQEFGLYPKVTAESLLDHFAVLKGVTDRRQRRALVHALFEQTNLYEHRRERLGEYSGGMKQRFGIAVALIGRPRLIIVDEPTAGLDPDERVRFLNLLSEIGEDSVVILSTHIVDDVSELCTRMAVIDQGRILLEAQPVAAMRGLDGCIWRKAIARDELDSLRERHHVLSTRLLAGQMLARVFAPERPDQSFAPAEPTLEDVYFAALRNYGGVLAVAGS
jgi:ABC-2 type transport system ATP-binding protein